MRASIGEISDHEADEADTSMKERQRITLLSNPTIQDQRKGGPFVRETKEADKAKNERYPKKAALTI